MKAAVLVIAASGLASSAAAQTRPEVLPMTLDQTGGGVVDFTPEDITMRFDNFYEQLSGVVPARGKITYATAGARLEPKAGSEGWRFKVGTASYELPIASTNQTYVSFFGRLFVRYISAPESKGNTVRTQNYEMSAPMYKPASNSETVAYTTAVRPRYVPRAGWSPCTGAAGWGEGNRVHLTLSQQFQLNDPYGIIPEGTPWSIAVGKPGGKSGVVVRFDVEWERCDPQENPMDKWATES